MRRTICTAVAFVAMSAHIAPAQAKDPLKWEGSGCHEIVATYPAPAVESDGVLVLLVYECDAMTIGDHTYKDVAVSEISVTDPCTSGATCPVRSRLLRQVANNHALVDGLQSLGVADSFLGQIKYNAGEGSATVHIPSQATYAIKATGDPPGTPGGKDPDDGMGGASYTYETKNKGTVEISYTNYSQTAREALVSVDTADDAQLARWLGPKPATTAGFVTRGHWTGTAESLDPPLLSPPSN